MIHLKRLLFLLALASSASADQVNFKLGGSLHTESVLTNKIASVGYTDRLTRLFDYRLETGFFAHNDVGYHVRTGFLSAGIGTGVKGSWYYSHVFFGPSVVTRTDDHLNTPLQFSTDVEFGLTDGRNVELGVGYKHLSNGGIFPGPNKGRDFLYIQLSLPLSR